MKKLLLLTTLAALTLIISCRGGIKLSPGSEKAGLSEVSVNLPKIDGVTYDGYYFAIKRSKTSVNDAKCTADYEVAKPLSEPKIAQEVKNKCNYLLILEIGMYDATSKKLTKTLYSNRANGSLGYELSESQLTGGTIPIQIKLFKTAENQIPNAPDNQITPGESHLDINVIMGGTPPSVQPQPPTPITPQPQPQPQTPTEVTFRIRAGLGGQSWNTAAEPLIVKLGQKLIVINDDNQRHQIHTDGVPFPHGQVVMGTGEKETVIPTQEFSGTLYCHLHQQNEKFYLKVVK